MHKLRYFLSIFIVFLALVVLNFLWVSFHLQGWYPDANQSLTPPQQSYDSLAHYIGEKESYVDVVSMDRGEFKLIINGKREFFLKDLDSILHEKLHVSEELALYSMVYMSQILESQDRNISELDFICILKAVESTLNAIEQKTIIPNKMKFNDHVISARLESLMLFYAYANDNYKTYLTSKRKTLLSKHILWCVKKLKDNKYFTWQSNHGLMQIRALFAFDFVFGTSAESDCNRIANERATKLLNFHIAKDGSVFESSSTYWFYISSLWNKIASFPNVPKQTVKIIRNRLTKTKQFLQTVATSTGFVQGMGDATNFYKKSFIKENKVSSEIYRWSNGLAEFSSIDSAGSELKVFFTSLHNPPNVHKHPEDLSVYVFYNQPFFINPGIYAYDGSWQRKYVRSQYAQNTVFSTIKNEPDSSSIQKVQMLKYGVQLGGLKYYNGDSIKRTVNFNSINGTINITDTSSGKLNIITSFNIHPNVHVKRINDTSLILSNNTNRVKMSSNNTILIDTAYISQNNLCLERIVKLKMTGKIIVTKLNILKYVDNNTVFVKKSDSKPDRLREKLSFILSKENGIQIFQKQSLKRLIIPRIGLFFIFFILYISFHVFNKKIIKIIIAFTYFSILLIDSIYLGVIVSLSYI